MSATGQLAQLKVLVTRPRHQAKPLLAALCAYDATPISFPVMEIVTAAGAAAALSRASEYDDLVFISANAVTQSLQFFTPGAQRILAIGGATREALAAQGIKVDLLPNGQENSENLLAHPALNDMHERRVLIIRGDNGRELLATQLRQRGAEVDYAEVYNRRIPIDADCSQLQQHWRQHVDIIITTSNSVIDNLLQLCNKHDEVLATPLLVISDRGANYARSLGFETLITARGASVEAIIEALCIYHCKALHRPQ